MKKHIPTILAIMVAVIATGLFVQRERPWYGRCEFGQLDTSLDFIVLGESIYVDRNNDGKPQSNELLSESDSLQVACKSGSNHYQIGSVGVGLSPSAVSSDSPQILNIDNVRSPNHNYKMYGTIVLSRTRRNSGNCHFFGPLVIQNYPNETFLPDGDAIVKIGLVTVDEDSTAVSPLVGASGALVYTSIPSDRDTFAFDDNVRPELDIVFQTTTAPVRQHLIIDGFC
jgi:hypothetical protein